MFKLYKVSFTVVSSLIFLSAIAHAEPLKIMLTESDQRRLTQELSKIDLPYRSEEIIQETPYRIVLKKFIFLDNSQAFYIHCSAQYHAFSTNAQNEQCEIGFDYERSQPNVIESHDGFMPNFAIAEIKDARIASVIYKSIGNGVSPRVSFNTQEQLGFTHPTNGNKFVSFRFRIECTRDTSWKNFNCIASAVK